MTKNSTQDPIPQLPDLPLDALKRVLVVVAHPDDAEYGLSAAVHRWTRSGIEVHYLLLTHGEAGIRTMEPAEAAMLRAAEQQEACDIVGVSSLTLADQPDGQLEYGLDLRRTIAEHIRRVKPDTVITANFDLEAYGGFNQADHRAAGLACIDAVSDADNPWVFQDLDLPTWNASRIAVLHVAQPTHLARVEEQDVLAGIASLEPRGGVALRVIER